MSTEHRRAADRFVVTDAAERRTTRHSFSFGPHYDPANLGFGPMVAHFDDRVEPGGGYAEHPHTDLEIVTWVLEGSLVHTDSGGRRTVVEPGAVQVMSAGSGIRHSEQVDPASGPSRFVQVWVRPDEPGTAPWHATADVAGALADGTLVPVVSGHRGDGLARIGTRRATLYAARLAAGARVRLPDEPVQHVYAARGAVAVGDLRLGPEDAVRLTDEPGRDVVAVEPAELLVWSFRD